MRNLVRSSVRVVRVDAAGDGAGPRRLSTRLGRRQVSIRIVDLRLIEGRDARGASGVALAGVGRDHAQRPGAVAEPAPLSAISPVQRGWCWQSLYARRDLFDADDCTDAPRPVLLRFPHGMRARSRQFRGQAVDEMRTLRRRRDGLPRSLSRDHSQYAFQRPRFTGVPISHVPEPECRAMCTHAPNRTDRFDGVTMRTSANTIQWNDESLPHSELDSRRLERSHSLNLILDSIGWRSMVRVLLHQLADITASLPRPHRKQQPQPVSKWPRRVTHTPDRQLLRALAGSPQSHSSELSFLRVLCRAFQHKAILKRQSLPATRRPRARGA